MASNVDPDQMLCSVASNLGLQLYARACLSQYIGYLGIFTVLWLLINIINSFIAITSISFYSIIFSFPYTSLQLVYFTTYDCV